MIRSYAFAFIPATLFSGCTSHRAADGNTVAALDSIVLERTPCYGTCPAYRLTIARGGAVRYLGKNVEDSAPPVSATIPAGLLDTLAARAAQIGFDQLPDTIANDRSLCVTAATAQSTTTVRRFGERWTAAGSSPACAPGRRGRPRAPPLVRLAAFGDLADSLPDPRRWIPPDRRR